MSSDEEALALYRAREDSAHERANLLYTGRDEGRIECKAAGIEEVAQKMLAENAPFDFILKVTGLSMEEIKALQAKGSGSAH